jgi:hypothetical protein
MRKQPWMKWYPSDWRSDPRLRMCSLAARGLWIEMLSLMHEAKPYGHLLVSGLAPSDTQLGVLTGVPPEQIPALVGELESAVVFSRTQKGVIYSRRMTRDFKKASEGRKSAKRRWDQPSENKDENTAPNGPPIGSPTTQMLDAICQKDSSANPATTEPYPESLTLQSEGDFKKIALGSGGSGSGSKFGNQQARDEYAASELAKVVGWDVVMAAEDPTAPNHDQACRACRAAAKAAGVGWVSPSFRNRESAA